MKLCPDCLSDYKRKTGGRMRARKHNQPWGRGEWPTSLYHAEPTRKCRPHHVQSLADSAARRAGLLQATPKWANRGAIRAVYERCMQITRDTGMPHEVDHIVPLRGERVSGLHVHWNLQVIPAVENRIKSNRF